MKLMSHQRAPLELKLVLFETNDYSLGKVETRRQKKTLKKKVEPSKLQFITFFLFFLFFTRTYHPALRF